MCCFCCVVNFYVLLMRFILLTILYCSSNIFARLECLSNMDTLKPSVFATWSWMTGCNCLWSPIRTTWRAPEHVIGTSDSGSMHMPHSSTMHCWMLSQEPANLGLPDAAHVQRMIWTPDSWRAHFSAFPMSFWKGIEQKSVLKKLTLNLVRPI